MLLLLLLAENSKAPKYQLLVVILGCVDRYTEQEFDHEFIEELSKFIYGYIKKEVWFRVCMDYY